MKKMIALLLAVAMLATLTACGKKNKDTNTDTEGSNNSGNTTTSTTQQVTTTTTDWAANLDGDNMFNDAELAW